VERRFDAYSDFLKRARSYRNVVRESVITEATFQDVDALAHAADSAGSLIPLVAESSKTIEACHRTLRAVRITQGVVHDPDQDSRMARRSKAVDELVLSLRQFQAEAREELGVGGVDRSWILTRGRPVKSADGT
jgi:hypothetical protein